jgi:hypothetical protein
MTIAVRLWKLGLKDRERNEPNRRSRIRVHAPILPFQLSTSCAHTRRIARNSGIPGDSCVGGGTRLRVSELQYRPTRFLCAAQY